MLNIILFISLCNFIKIYIHNNIFCKQYFVGTKGQNSKKNFDNKLNFTHYYYAYKTTKILILVKTSY